ncbi:MAG: hypothetical protein CMJ49_12655 [Planctomycetaceae bacterium]|nr:hypothetical protein [Planctomycetaceae bacterium]
MQNVTAPIISMLTDFGSHDPYVGVMKGVMLARCPEARIVDLTHDVPPQNIHAAGYLLGANWRYFPPGTVHLVVIDPGVGGERRILAVQTGGHTFLAPDNGLLSELLEHSPADRIVSVENESLFVQPVSRTFHGRDVFAPVAAALAGGLPIDDVGPAANGYLHLPGIRPQRDADGQVSGEIIWIDHFGNLVTNITVDQLPSAPRIEVGGRVMYGLTNSYGNVGAGEPLALIGSTSRLEIAVNHGNAAESLGMDMGDPVHVRSE